MVEQETPKPKRLVIRPHLRATQIRVTREEVVLLISKRDDPVRVRLKNLGLKVLREVVADRKYAGDVKVQDGKLEVLLYSDSCTKAQQFVEDVQDDMSDNQEPK